MIKRTIEISQEAVHLAIELDQLRLLRQKPAQGLLASIPCEDIGMLVVDNPHTTFSQTALVRLIENGAAVVVCGRNHLPAGLLLPLSDHTEVVWRLHDQIAVPRPLRKRLWKQLIIAKIRGQAANLPSAARFRQRLLKLTREVKSGDSANIEAQAAKLYWAEWLGEGSDFHRDPSGADYLNAMLNYGYAVVRAAVARALVSAGLHPALGLMHRNRSNSFCLADDLLEPFRPMVDRAVRGLHHEGKRELNRDSKKELLALLTSTVRVKDQSGPFMVALHHFAASLVRCFQGTEEKLDIPDWREQTG